MSSKKKSDVSSKEELIKASTVRIKSSDYLQISVDGDVQEVKNSKSEVGGEALLNDIENEIPDFENVFAQKGSGEDLINFSQTGQKEKSIISLSTTKHLSLDEFDSRSQISCLVPLHDTGCLFCRTYEKRVAILDSESILIAGRGKDSHIQLKSAQVSRVHCAFDFLDGKWMVEDLNSTNGVLINREPIKDKRVIKNGDNIIIGDYIFTFFTGTDAEHCIEKKSFPPAVWKFAPYPVVAARSSVEQFESPRERLPYIVLMCDITIRYLTTLLFGALRTTDFSNPVLLTLLSKIHRDKKMSLGTWVELLIHFDKLFEHNKVLPNWNRALFAPRHQKSLRYIAAFRNRYYHEDTIPPVNITVYKKDLMKVTDIWDMIIEKASKVFACRMFTVVDHPQILPDGTFKHLVRMHMGPSDIFSSYTYTCKTRLLSGSCYADANGWPIPLSPVFYGTDKFYEEEPDIFWARTLLGSQNSKSITITSLRNSTVKKQIISERELLEIDVLLKKI